MRFIPTIIIPCTAPIPNSRFLEKRFSNAVRQKFNILCTAAVAELKSDKESIWPCNYLLVFPDFRYSFLINFVIMRVLIHRSH